VRGGSRWGGDFSSPRPDEALEARSQLAQVPWTWLRQVHGAQVLVVSRPAEGRGSAADAAVTTCAGAGLAVLTADCAPIALSSPNGVVGIAHAGWRGLLAGVVEATVAAMRGLGAGSVFAALGACIRPHAYAFSPGDLDLVAARFGCAVRGQDEEGRPALDLPAAVKVALGEAGAELVADAGICTHCSVEHWSWRARRDRARQATVAWRPLGS